MCGVCGTCVWVCVCEKLSQGGETVCLCKCGGYKPPDIPCHVHRRALTGVQHLSHTPHYSVAVWEEHTVG